MRTFWLWLMIGLLPLRALAGGAMAIPIQQGTFAATGQVQTLPVPDVPGCHGPLHAAQQAHGAMPQPGAMHPDGSEPGSAGHATLCLVCDACHGSTPLGPTPRFEEPPPTATVPAHVHGPISSAERLPLHKPPIA